MRTEDLMRLMDFLYQNERVRQGFITLTDDETEAVMECAEHHCGGLFVLGKKVGNRYVKLHDSWGDTDEVVVHSYDPDAEDTDEETYFTNGADAIRYFLSL